MPREPEGKHPSHPVHSSVVTRPVLSLVTKVIYGTVQTPLTIWCSTQRVILVSHTHLLCYESNHISLVPRPCVKWPGNEAK